MKNRSNEICSNEICIRQGSPVVGKQRGQPSKSLPTKSFVVNTL